MNEQLTIALVDDDPKFIDEIIAKLSEMGHQVLPALTDAEKAITEASHFAEQGVGFALIVLRGNPQAFTKEVCARVTEAINRDSESVMPIGISDSDLVPGTNITYGLDELQALYRFLNAGNSGGGPAGGSTGSHERFINSLF